MFGVAIPGIPLLLPQSGAEAGGRGLRKDQGLAHQNQKRDHYPEEAQTVGRGLFF